MPKKTPTILIFACEWIPYAAADNAGRSGEQYPSETRIIRLNCSGRITPAQLIGAFKNGAGGVLVAGCAEGECHYVNGNGQCQRVVEETKKLLDLLGLEASRLECELFAEMGGAHFAKVVREFTERIRTIERTADEVLR